MPANAYTQPAQGAGFKNTQSFCGMLYSVIRFCASYSLFALGTWLTLLLAEDDDLQSACVIGVLSIFTLPEFNDAVNLLAPDWCRCNELTRRDCIYTDWCSVWFLRGFQACMLKFWAALTFQETPEARAARVEREIEQERLREAARLAAKEERERKQAEREAERQRLVDERMAKKAAYNAAIEKKRREEEEARRAKEEAKRAKEEAARQLAAAKAAEEKARAEAREKARREAEAERKAKLAEEELARKRALAEKSRQEWAMRQQQKAEEAARKAEREAAEAKEEADRAQAAEEKRKARLAEARQASKLGRPSPLRETSPEPDEKEEEEKELPAKEEKELPPPVTPAKEEKETPPPQKESTPQSSRSKSPLPNMPSMRLPNRPKVPDVKMPDLKKHTPKMPSFDLNAPGSFKFPSPSKKEPGEEEDAFGNWSNVKNTWGEDEKQAKQAKQGAEEHIEYGEGWDGYRRETHWGYMVATVLPKEKIEVFWGRHHGGWIKGQVVERASADDEIVEMEGQPTKSSRSHAWVVEFEDGDTCAVDLRPGWAGHKDSPGQWRPQKHKDLGAELP